jgi:hypothetical protein
VDLQTDNNNCGSCGKPCNGPNQGCAGGTCGSATTFTAPAVCAGGGPPVSINPGSGSVCLGNLAQTTFTWSLCSCKSVNFMDNALVDGWNSTVGPYKPGQLGGGVGADVSISCGSSADIWGQSWAASMATAYDASGYTVHHDLQSGGNMTADGVSAMRDAYVAGNITGNMTVSGTLYQPMAKAHAGLKYVDTNVVVKPPCDCMSPIPVANTVTWAKTNNDNASIGLDPAIMATGHSPRVDLPCGRYYMQGFNNGGLIVAHGHVALFIDGSASAGTPLTMTVADATSTFDIWISGTITATSNFYLGNPSYPALTRVYVGGTSLDVQSQLIIGAEIWAGNATVTWESGSDLFGALFAGDFQALSAFRLHHDQGVDYAGSSCPPPAGSGSSSGGTTTGGTTASSSGGPGGATCGTCKDCGNQACVNGTCSQCSASSQCCPPLVCLGGTCSPPAL